MLYENENTEFKSALTGDIYKEVIAFANNGGGVIYIGVDDNGNEIGVADVDETYTRLTNGIRDAISPDVTVFCKYSLNENNVIKIERCICASRRFKCTRFGGSDTVDDQNVGRRFL